MREKNESGKAWPAHSHSVSNFSKNITTTTQNGSNRTDLSGGDVHLEGSLTSHIGEIFPSPTSYGEDHTDIRPKGQGSEGTQQSPECRLMPRHLTYLRTSWAGIVEIRGGIKLTVNSSADHVVGLVALRFHPTTGISTTSLIGIVVKGALAVQASTGASGAIIVRHARELLRCLCASRNRAVDRGSWSVDSPRAGKRAKTLSRSTNRR